MQKPRCIYCNSKTDYGSNICLKCYTDDVALKSSMSRDELVAKYGKGNVLFRQIFAIAQDSNGNLVLFSEDDERWSEVTTFHPEWLSDLLAATRAATDKWRINE